MKKVDPLAWLLDWTSSDRNFSTYSNHQITRQLMADPMLVGRLAAPYKKLTLQTGAAKAQITLTDMILECIFMSDLVVTRHRAATSRTRPTRTEQVRELRVLAGDLESVRTKLKSSSETIANAISVDYLTGRHDAGNAAGYSKLRMLSLRLDRPVFDMALTVEHLLTALHDDIEETADSIQRNIHRKRQTRGSDALAADMIDAIGRAVRVAIGSLSGPMPTSLVADLCRLLLTAHGYDKTLDESTVRSRLKNLAKV